MWRQKMLLYFCSNVLKLTNSNCTGTINVDERSMINLYTWQGRIPIVLCLKKLECLVALCRALLHPQRNEEKLWLKKWAVRMA